MRLRRIEHWKYISGISEIKDENTVILKTGRLYRKPRPYFTENGSSEDDDFKNYWIVVNEKYLEILSSVQKLIEQIPNGINEKLPLFYPNILWNKYIVNNRIVESETSELGLAQGIKRFNKKRDGENVRKYVTRQKTYWHKRTTEFNEPEEEDSD